MGEGNVGDWFLVVRSHVWPNASRTAKTAAAATSS